MMTPPGGVHSRTDDRQRTPRGLPLRLRRPLPAPLPEDPSDEELLLLVDGSIDGLARADLEARAARSSYCSDRLELLQEALAEAGFARPRSLRARAARLVFVAVGEAVRFLRGTEEPLESAAAGARAAGPGAPPGPGRFAFHREFDGCAAQIEVEQVEGTDIGLAFRLRDPNGPASDLSVSLSRAGAAIDTASCDAGGSCDFRPLRPGRYDVAIRRRGEPVGHLVVELLRQA